MSLCPSPESLLADAAWLRSLTRRLMGDAELAADLEQEVAVAALATPEAARGGRSWLAAIAHNLAALLWRRAGRERHRLQKLAVPDLAPPAADLVSAAELQQRAVAAVLALPPVYRDTVLLRFLQGLSLEQTARKLGVPAETVRTRQRRALAQLRAQLMPEHARSRGGLAALMGIGVVMQTKHVVVAVTLLLSLASSPWWFPAANAPDPLEPAPAATIATAPLDEAPGRKVDAPAPERTTVAVPAPSTVPPNTVPPSPVLPPAEARATIVVEVAWEEETTKVADRVVLCRAPHGPGIFATTGATGQARFEQLAAGSYSVCTSNMFGCDVQLKAGDEKKVTLQIPRGLTVRGRVVDPDDAPVPFAEIFARHAMMWPAWPFPVARADAQGRFEVAGLSTNETVGARHAQMGISKSEFLRQSPASGNVVEIVLRLPRSGLATVRGRVVDARNAPVSDAWVQVRQLAAIQQVADGSMRIPPRADLGRTDADGRFAAEWSLPGRNTLYVYRRGFAPHRQELQLVANEPAHVNVELRAGATLTGSVRDANGKAAVGATVSCAALEHPQVGWQNIGADGAFRFEDLPAGELTFVVWHQQHSQLSNKLAVTGVENHSWHAVLTSGGVVRGRLLDQKGAPLVRWFLTRHGSNRWAESDDEGRFLMPDCKPEGNTILVRPSQTMGPTVMRFLDVRVTADEQVFVVPADRAPSAHLRGQCLGPDGSPLQGVLLRLDQDGRQVDAKVKSGGDGTFTIGPLPPGPYSMRPTHLDCTFDAVAIELQPHATQDLGSLRGRRQ